jgi:hypothetical protein
MTYEPSAFLLKHGHRILFEKGAAQWSGMRCSGLVLCRCSAKGRLWNTVTVQLQVLPGKSLCIFCFNSLALPACGASRWAERASGVCICPVLHLLYIRGKPKAQGRFRGQQYTGARAWNNGEGFCCGIGGFDLHSPCRAAKALQGKMCIHSPFAAGTGVLSISAAMGLPCPEDVLPQETAIILDAKVTVWRGL